MEEARVKKLELLYYGVIYDCIEEMGRRMDKILSPTPEGELAGKAEVKMVFDSGLRHRKGSPFHLQITCDQTPF